MEQQMRQLDLDLTSLLRGHASLVHGSDATTQINIFSDDRSDEVAAFLGPPPRTWPARQFLTRLVRQGLVFATAWLLDTVPDLGHHVDLDLVTIALDSQQLALLLWKRARAPAPIFQQAERLARVLVSRPDGSAAPLLGLVLASISASTTITRTLLIPAVQHADPTVVRVLLKWLPPNLPPEQIHAAFALAITSLSGSNVLETLLADPWGRFDPTVNAWEFVYYAMHHDASDALRVLLADQRIAVDEDDSAADHLAELASMATMLGHKDALCTLYRSSSQHSLPLEPRQMWFTACVSESMCIVGDRSVMRAASESDLDRLVRENRQAGAAMHAAGPVPRRLRPHPVLHPQKRIAASDTPLLGLPKDVLWTLHQYMDPRSASRFRCVARATRDLLPTDLDAPTRLIWLLLHAPKNQRLSPEIRALLYSLPPNQGAGALNHYPLVAAAARLDAPTVLATLPHLPPHAAHVAAWALTEALDTADTRLAAVGDSRCAPIVLQEAAACVLPIAAAWTRPMTVLTHRPILRRVLASTITTGDMTRSIAWPADTPASSRFIGAGLVGAPSAVVSGLLDAFLSAPQQSDVYFQACASACRLGNARILGVLRAHPYARTDGTAPDMTELGSAVAAHESGGDMAILVREAFASGSAETLCVLFSSLRGTTPASPPRPDATVEDAADAFLNHAPEIWQEWPREVAEIAACVAGAGQYMAAGLLVRAVWRKVMAEIGVEDEVRAEIGHAVRRIRRLVTGAELPATDPVHAVLVEVSGSLSS
ncbi:hypothetical protein BC828DRAFT_374468 [Blastocladiella britannica]|nr:hypothetical protein BC828DRAFT_374468 [Blastocladiella britannica]